MRHLSDDEIQTYLDGGARGLAPNLRHHLDTCSRCQEELRAYRAVYTQLADDTMFQAPSTLATAVLAKLGPDSVRPRRALPADIMVVAGAIACMVVIAFSFLDLSPFIEYGANSVGSVRDLVVGLNHMLTLALAGVAALILVDGLDRAVRTRKVPYRRN